MDPFVGEIRMFAGNFAPTGWAFCNGQILAIAQNTALFSLLGTTYGGDGRTTFALPDLQGRAPLHQGQGSGLTGRVLGESGGQGSVTLLPSEMPAHGHAVNCDAGPGTQTSPANNLWAGAGRGRPPFYADTANTALGTPAVGTAGGGQPHNNMSPYLAVNFIIALQGIYPPRS